MHDDTIFAVASGAGRAAVAVLRVSGAESARLLTALAGRMPPARRASVRRLRHGGAELDHALVLWLPGPGSYTGEDCAELHLHGGRAVIEGVAEALVALGARPAEPGEFTKRAFLNGRMDLVAAEAVADLVDAETSAQRAQALRQMDGALGAIYRDWAERLRVLLAEQEALIDFPDEDLPADGAARGEAELVALREEIAAHLDDGRRGERLREGLVFAVTGPPNVGKSSLVNALAERDVAIVAATPGTTRDTLETRVVLGGVPVTLVDTAGLRETADAVEAEGVRRARARAEDADLVVAVASVDVPSSLCRGCPGPLRTTAAARMAGTGPAVSVRRCLSLTRLILMVRFHQGRSGSALGPGWGWTGCVTGLPRRRGR
jgi:tRNA modification GTPase